MFWFGKIATNNRFKTDFQFDVFNDLFFNRNVYSFINRPKVIKGILVLCHLIVTFHMGDFKEKMPDSQRR